MDLPFFANLSFNAGRMDQSNVRRGVVLYYSIWFVGFS